MIKNSYAARSMNAPNDERTRPWWRRTAGSPQAIGEFPRGKPAGK